MSKKAKSQWDFGELFSAEETQPGKKTPGVAKELGKDHRETSNAEHRISKVEGENDQTQLTPAATGKTEGKRRVLTVGELTGEVKRLLEKGIGQVWVTGEVTNFRAQASGHFYFTLKDAESQLNCVLFRNEARGSRELVQDGRKLVLQGELTVYEPRGQYQLRVTAVELQGVGALQLAFEKLKQKLSAEGLFAAERKRPLPRYPQRIGLVTSPTGAAIRDVLHVVQRRHAGLEIVLAPCRVQGQGAAEEIAEAIRMLNEFGVRSAECGIEKDMSKPAASKNYFDLILITRGGGSLEDLWAFNEEVVARAIHESKLPVVSAVGHEIDFTIADFVADLRAATPSAAAELITEGVYSSGEFVRGARGRMAQLTTQRIAGKEWELKQIMGRMARMHPRRRFNEWLQELDDLEGGLLRCVKQGVRNQRIAWRNLQERLSRVRPGVVIKQRRELLEQLAARFGEETRRVFKEARDEVADLETRLRLLGPEQVLARGYSITMDEKTGKAIRSAAEVKPGQRLRTRLKVGEVRSKAEP